MKGLLLKEAYTIKSYCRTFLVFLLFFMVMGMIPGDNSNAFIMIYPFVLVGMLPVTLLSYDEREHWNTTCETLPVTRSQYVTALYLTGFILNMVLILLYAVAFAIRFVMGMTFTGDDVLGFITMVSAISFIVPSVCLPIMFKFGTEKGRLIYLGIVAVIVGGFTAVAVSTDMSFLQSTFHVSFLPRLLIPLAGLILYVVSCLLSRRIYQNREL